MRDVWVLKVEVILHSGFSHLDFNQRLCSSFLPAADSLASRQPLTHIDVDCLPCALCACGWSLDDGDLAGDGVLDRYR